MIVLMIVEELYVEYLVIADYDYYTLGSDWFASTNFDVS